MQLGDARTGKLADNIAAFGRALRRAGVPVDSSRIALAQTAAMLVGVDRKDDLSAALECVLIAQEQDRTVFAQMFEAFFRNPELAHQLLAQMLPQTQESAKATVPRRARVQEALRAVAQAKNRPPAKDEEIELDAAMSASQAMRLHHADFQSLNASEFRLVEQLARTIPMAMPRIRGRRMQTGPRGHRMDWTRAMRDAARQGGELMRMPHLQRRQQPLPLLILIDVSGSMERYARLMLAFLHQATRQVPRSVFSFGTTLTDLNGPFQMADTDDMLFAVGEKIADFAGGTRLGLSLEQLRTHHQRQLVGRRTVVLLITDGLDTGSIDALGQELSWLERHCRKLLWLNPLLRFDGYAPIASGAQVLNRHADGMLAIHNMARLQDLAQAITRLLKI